MRMVIFMKIIFYVEIVGFHLIQQLDNHKFLEIVVIVFVMIVFINLLQKENKIQN